MQQLKAAHWATAVYFFVTGAVVGAWVPYIPERAQALQLNAAQLGTTLLGGGIGAVIAMPLAGALIPRFGSRMISIVGGVGFPVFFLAGVLAPNRGLLLAALIAYGLCGAGMDVAMNAQAVLIERKAERRIISSLHGIYSAGNVAGSLITSAALERGVSSSVLAGSITAVLLIATLASGPFMLKERPTPAEKARKQRTFAPQLILLGMLVIAAMVSEGGIADWSASYLRGVRKLGPGWAGLGFAAFSATMLLGRLLGDRVVDRWGEVWTLRLGGAFGAIGALLAVFGPGRLGTLAGFALLGAGLANASPVLYRTAGQMRGIPAGVGLATAVGMGYAGLLAGPPLLGFVGQAWGLGSILIVLAALCALLGATASISRQE